MRRFQQVDVFSPDPLRGNPVAVVLDAEGLTTQQMVDLTRWTNLSEAAFVLPPTATAADYRVRIFFAAGELDFAGHPTLGSCHAWLRAGGVPHQPGMIVQECPTGLVRIRQTDIGLAFEAPPTHRSGSLEAAELERFASILGVPVSEVVDSHWVDNGPGWAALLLESADAVLRLVPTPDDGERIDLGVVGPCEAGAETAYAVRAFFSNARGELVEDPVTGSLNASLAQWLIDSGRFTAPYVASQGSALDRSGRVHITQSSDGAIWVGGNTTTVVEGLIDLD